MQSLFKFLLIGFLFPTFISGQNNPKEIDSLLFAGSKILNTDLLNALSIGKSGLEASRKIHYKKGEALSLLQLGRVYRRQGNSLQALIEYIKAANIFESQNDFLNLASVYNSIGVIYENQGDYKKSLSYEKKALEFLNKAKNLSWHDSIIYFNIYHQTGVVYFDLKEYQKSATFFLEELHLSKIMGDKQGERIGYDDLGLLCLKEKKSSLALSYFQKALKTNSQPTDPINTIISSLNIGDAYLAIGKLNDAELNYQNAYRLSDSLKDNNLTVSSLIALIKLEKEKRNFEKALTYQEKYFALNDSLFYSEKNIKLIEVEAKYQAEKKEKENELLTLQNESREIKLSQQRSQKILLLLSIIILLAFIAFVFFQLIKARKINKRLQNLILEKNTIMNALSHDLRIPLTKIDSQIYSLYLDEISLELKNKYLQIRNIISDGMDMVTNILDASYLDEKEPKIKIIELDYLELLQIILEENNALATLKKISFNLQVKTENIIIYSDRTLLKRVLDNLISNALKFSFPNSIVTIIVQETSDKKVCFSIEDNGVGIKEEDLPKLFKRYGSFSSLPTGEETSMGLGLYISSRLVIYLKGKIWCKSEWEKGSTFFVEFPVSILQEA
jgi:signal transduction histidine kinase